MNAIIVVATGAALALMAYIAEGPAFSVAIGGAFALGAIGILASPHD